MGVSHALGHKIGPLWDVPHGVTSCITLPHVMRFMADVAPQRFRRIAEALDVPFDDPRAAALASADKVALPSLPGFDVPHRSRPPASNVPRSTTSPRRSQTRWRAREDRRAAGSRSTR